MSDVTTTEDFKIIGPIMGIMMAALMLTMFPQPVVAETANLSGSVVDTDGNPVSAALVTLNGAASESSADGVYGFLGVTSGDYSLSVANAEALGYQAKAPISIHLNAGENSQDIILTPQTQKANLSGTVKDSQSNLPIAGIALTLDSRTASTNSSGLYSFTDVNLGTYTLTASKAGYGTKTLTVTLSSGDNNKDFTMDPEGADVRDIDGYITDEDTGAKIEDVYIICGGKDDYSLADGYYRLYGVAIGTHDITYTKIGYVSKTDSIDLVAGSGPYRYNVVLTPTMEPQAKFEVTDLQITPPEVYVGETVEISGLVTNVGDAAGQYTVNCNVSPGTYTALAVVPAVEIVWADMINTVITMVIIMMFMGAAAKMMK